MGMPIRFAVALLFGVVLSGFLGCASRLGVPIQGEQTVILKSGVRVAMHDISLEEKALLTKALDRLPKRLQESVVAINGGKCSRLSFSEQAHCHWDRIICLRYFGSYEIICEYLWHEIGHAHTMVCGLRLEYDWKSVAGRVYGVHAPSEKSFFPQSAILENHGGRDYLEDIACWVKAVYFYRDGFRHPFRMADKSDPRYMEKLNLLLQYEFITSNEYKKVSPLLRE